MTKLYLLFDKVTIVLKLRKTLFFRQEHTFFFCADETDNIEEALEDATARFREKGIKSLFIFYSGHFEEEEGGRFFWKTKRTGSSEEMVYIGRRTIEAKIRSIDELAKVVSSFDCCKAPDLVSSMWPRHCVVFQMNACSFDHKAFADINHTNSFFTRFFIQGLTLAVIPNQKCYFEQKDNSHVCKVCSKCRSIKKTGYITIIGLFKYVNAHMRYHFLERTQEETADDRRQELDWKPTLSVLGLNRANQNIAYRYFKSVSITFVIKTPQHEPLVISLDPPADPMLKSIYPDYFVDYDSIKTELFNKFLGEYGL